MVKSADGRNGQGLASSEDLLRAGREDLQREHRLSEIPARVFTITVNENEATVVEEITPPVRVTYVKRHVWASGNPAVEVVVDEVPPSGDPMEVFLGLGEGLILGGGASEVEVVWTAEDEDGKTATFLVTPIVG